jgi:hypothetical protein
MLFRTTIRIVLVGTLLVITLPFALSDEDHYINTFLGDRAAGMAGAYTAVADGPEGSIYNPAGLAFAGSSYISLSTNALQFKRTTYKDLVPGVDWRKDSFSFIPNFFGIVQKFGATTFGFTIATPDNESVEQRDFLPLPLYYGDGTPILDGSGNQIYQDKMVNIDILYDVTDIGFSFSWLLGRRVSIGVGLAGIYENDKRILQNIDQIIYIDQDQIDTVYSRDQIFKLRPQIGLQIMPIDILSIGITVSSPIPIVGVYNSQNSFMKNIGATDPATYSSQINRNTSWNENLFSDGWFETSYIKSAIGVALFLSKSIVLAIDGYFYFPLNPADIENTYRKQFTWNAAIGLEWYISPNFPLRVGIFTNNANTPNIDSTQKNQADHSNLLGGTASIGFSTADFALNIGTAISHSIHLPQIGSESVGQAISEKAGEIVTQEMSIFAATVFISGGYQF